MHHRIEDQHFDASLLPRVEDCPRTEAALLEPVLYAIRTAVASGNVTAASVFAGRVYERKSELCTTAFGDQPNPSYSSDEDDFYLQLAVRVPRYAPDDVHGAVRAVELLSTDALRRKAEERLSDAQTLTAAAVAEEARIQAEIDRLDNLTGGRP